MAFDKAKQYLDEKGFGDRVLTFDVSSATVELAAVAVGTEPEKICKSLTFKVNGTPIMVLFAGDAKVSNSKFKAHFKTKATMLSREEATLLIGHDIGGVCPFGINPGVDVYMDQSLRRFDTVYPACGNAASAVRLSIHELEQLSSSKGWVDVSSIPEI